MNTPTISLSSLVIRPDNPTVVKWLGKGAVIIAQHWNERNHSLKVVSEWGGEYQVLRAFYLSHGLLVSEVPEPEVSIDLRTQDPQEVIRFLVEGRKEG